MSVQKTSYHISTFKGTIIILIAAAISLLVFGVLYYFWIEGSMSTKVPEIFDLSRVAGVNLNANLKPYTEHIQGISCQKDSDCSDNFVCYTSRECKPSSSGTICGPELGDLLCHKKCMDDSDCPAEMPVCQGTDFFINNTSVLIKICST